MQNNLKLFNYEEPPVKPVKRRTVPAAKWTDLKASNPRRLVPPAPAGKAKSA